MNAIRVLFAVLLVVALSGCGLFYGQAMRVNEGVRNVKVVSGDLGGLRQGQRVLVIGPFAKTREAFYICRGEEAASFAQYFNEKGLFRADLSVAPGFDDPREMEANIKKMVPNQLASRFALDQAPALILFGTILSREMFVAPGRGVIMSVAYRLEFFDPQTRKSTIVEVADRDLFADCIPNVVTALMEKIAHR